MEIPFGLPVAGVIFALSGHYGAASFIGIMLLCSVAVDFYCSVFVD